MKLRAKYRTKNFNPFIANFNAFCSQFKYTEAEVSDDADMAEMERFAREKTPEGYVFVELKKI